MDVIHDLDPKLQHFADRAVAEIAVPALDLDHTTPARRGARPALVVLIAVAGVVLLASGAAVGAGVLSEVFHIGNVSAVGSRGVTLEDARVAQVPLPASQRLGGWTLSQVQLTMTEQWRAVDLQYGRSGSRGMGIGVWSEGINVTPTGEHVRNTTVSGVTVELVDAGGQRTARFTQRGATVILRVFTNEVREDELISLVGAWLNETR